MNSIDTLNLQGHLTISKKYVADGRVEVVFDKDNLIVKAAKQFLLSGIFTTGVVSDPVSVLQAGTGGNVDPEGLYPKLEDSAQNSLTTSVISIPTTNIPDMNAVKVTFLADVDQSQCNGLMLTEVGLFKSSGNMFNVKNHPGITKSSEFSVHYSWTIKFL